jgi:membrane protease YdiL (CAAX protease family)
LIINLGEEIGWRGYALPKLQQRFRPLTSSVLLGAAWAAFHWVALAQNPTQPVLYLLVATVSLVAMSVVMTWLFNHTGSIILMVLVHAMYDVITLGVVPLAQTTTPLLAFSLTAATLGLVAATLRLAVGSRLGQPAQSNHQTPSSRNGITAPERNLGR